MRYVLGAHYGKRLPILDYESALDAVEVAEVLEDAKPLVEAERVPAPAPGDVAVVRFAGLPAHVGVYLGGGCILHVMPALGTTIERQTSARLRARVEGFYRVR